VFERFSDPAVRVIGHAQGEAKRLNHNFIGTEHLLLGLLREPEGVAAQALAAASIGLDDVRARVEAMIGVGQSMPSGHIPVTPRAKKVLELSLREALRSGHNSIGTGHILLGLVREGEGVAAQVLLAMSGDLTLLRREVSALVAESEAEPVTRSTRKTRDEAAGG